jgi:hypothetical protein
LILLQRQPGQDRGTLRQIEEERSDLLQDHEQEFLAYVNHGKAQRPQISSKLPPRNHWTSLLTGEAVPSLKSRIKNNVDLAGVSVVLYIAYGFVLQTAPPSRTSLSVKCIDEEAPHFNFKLN